MKTTTNLFLVLGLLLFAAGCKPSNRVTFKPVNMSVDVGEGWKRLDIPVNPPACTPSLVGGGGMINAVSLEDYTDVKEAADFLQSSFSNINKAVKDSFKQENFTTDSGLNGIHLSYTASPKSVSDPDRRSHSFIVHNMKGKCVSISYITSPTEESPAVLEAIRKTLRVE